MRAPASFPYPASSPPRTVCLVLLAPLLSLAQGIAPTPSHPLAPAADAARVAGRPRRALPSPGAFHTSWRGRLGSAPPPPHPRPPSKVTKAPTVITTGTTAAAAATASPLHPRRCINATTHREASHEPPSPNAAHFSTPFPTPVPATLPAGRCSRTGRLRQCLARWPAR